MNQDVIDLDGASCDVLGTSGRNFSLVRHSKERQIVNVENKLFRLHVVVKLNLPLKFVVLQL